MKEILIDIAYQTSRAAVLDGGELEFVLIDGHETAGGVGNIYRGRVDNVLKGMQSAFVDIGLEKNAFLPSGENKNRKLKCGDEIIVQVEKEAEGVKGAKVTETLTVPGHYLVLMPGNDYVGISKKITDENTRLRLKETVEKYAKGENGYIVRTEAENANEDDIKREIEYLDGEWAKIKANKSMGILYREDGLLLTVLRDYCDEDTEKITVNDEDAFNELKNIASVISPHAVDKIFLKNGDLFFGIESKIKKLLDRKVWLDNGAYLIIDRTEALTVIDVNTGKFTGNYDISKTILKTNIEAAREIARQLRLRAIGGIIVVDFIDMESDEERAQVLEALEAEAKKDKIKTNVIGFAPLGLVEMTRKKTRLSLDESLQRECPYCEGDGRILDYGTTVDRILRELARMQNKNAVVRVNPYILEKLKEVPKKYFPQMNVYARPDAGMHLEDYNVSAQFDEFSATEGLVKLV